MAPNFEEKSGAQEAAVTTPSSHTEADVENGSSTASIDKDIAYVFAGTHAHAIDPVVEKRVLRKIDWFLIPAMIVGMWLSVGNDGSARTNVERCDTQAILGSAVLFGMTTDLELAVVVDPTTTPPTVSTDRLSWATSIFYFGMLAGLYPMTFALQRFNIGRVLGPLVVFWGGICMMTAAVTSWQGLYAQRFFLGFIESVIPTGFMCIVSGYYTQGEQALRHGLWFSGTAIFVIIGSSLNYGFGQITGGDLKRWQYIYLLAGSCTVLFGIWCFAVPNSPAQAWFLTSQERLVAVERLRKGQTGVRCQKLKLDQIKEAALDSKVWLIAIVYCSAYTINGAVSGFGPLIVNTFGWTVLESILIQYPVGGLALIFMLLCGWIAMRYRNTRLIQLMLCCLPLMAGCAMIWKSEWTHRAPTPVAGYALLGFYGPIASLAVAIGMENTAGATKKSVMAATIFVAYCVGNIIGPQMVRSESVSDHYPELWLGIICCYIITILASVALYYVMWAENRRRDRAMPVIDEEERDKLAFSDLTDKQNPYFRYVL
ncbi:major facilitator superfamily domain-containing protein [Lineolata rhizophorae]|uniref:Major facilitator superfamily domain-containing protein n=1 Tax=Lineolata rhizophorae TaxID=578093 RepID=A0A6A6PDF8_9PEZI|nr:major facilitator superfamily domain-containing protein [Lineolata rhizophorae]